MQREQLEQLLSSNSIIRSTEKSLGKIKVKHVKLLRNRAVHEF